MPNRFAQIVGGQGSDDHGTDTRDGICSFKDKSVYDSAREPSDEIRNFNAYLDQKTRIIGHKKGPLRFDPQGAFTTIPGLAVSAVRTCN